MQPWETLFFAILHFSSGSLIQDALPVVYGHAQPFSRRGAQAHTQQSVSPADPLVNRALGNSWIDQKGTEILRST
jgi:hypothetical protein